MSEKKIGRPHKEIDQKEARKLAAMGCTMKEMAAFFECSVKHLETHSYESIVTGRQLAKTSLRSIAWDQARKGNSTALRFLFETILDWKPAATLDLKNYTAQIKDLSNDELAKLTEEKVAQLRTVREAGDE
jgi:hypothetical protein